MVSLNENKLNNFELKIYNYQTISEKIYLKSIYKNCIKYIFFIKLIFLKQIRSLNKFI